MATSPRITETDAPREQPRETIDVRELPPPLRQALERLVDLDSGPVLVQRNDRAPQRLYPKLTDRGYEYDTIEAVDDVVTIIWES